jgi:DNA helicase II / ATP-dependent DNA helicase PcrA
MEVIVEGNAKNIIESDHTPIRVLAGPGTGKTFALKQRVARLLKDGHTPERILVCTFTRTAANDLKKEIRSLGVDGAQSINAGTLHSFCFNLLSKEEVFEITGRVARPLLKYEERFLIEDLQNPIYGNYHEKKKLLEAFNAGWARLQNEDPGWCTDPVDNAFGNDLHNWLNFHHSMLIGEVIPESLKYLRENPAAQPLHAFDHILVDEYQDLNKAEQVLLDVLSEKCNLIVIGDEDQSIYSFKCAHPEGIANFHVSHPDTDDQSLDECRRCPQHVVEYANNLIRNNIQRSSRQLKPRTENPEGEIHVIQWEKELDEALGLARIIKHYITKKNIDPGSVLVLAPGRHIGYAIRNALKNLDINAHSFFHEELLDGTSKDLDSSRAQQAFCLLTLLSNPEDRVALRCWCGFGSDSLRKNAWARLRAHCEVSGESPRQVLQKLVNGSLRLSNVRDIVNRFILLEDKMQSMKDLKGEALIDELFPAGEGWADPFRTLSFGLEKEEISAPDLLSALRVEVIQPELPMGVTYVRIMSLHKSKGLTADMVVIASCIDGLIPRINVEDTVVERQEKLQEQRRLFYVAVTRTKNILILSSISLILKTYAYRMRIPRGGGRGDFFKTLASQFLAELGPTRPRAITGDALLEKIE